MNEERKITNIDISRIIPNIYQPRIKFDEKSINELATSIKNHGIIQPLILRNLGDRYEIIDGERRYKAAKKIGLNNVPAIVLDIDEKEAAELTLEENLQNEILSPIEEATAYQQIMLLNKYTIEGLAKKLELDKKVVENKLKLLTLLPEIQEALLNNKISEGHAKALTKVLNKKEQYDLYQKVINERLTVKTLEELINNKDKDQKEEPNSKDLENVTIIKEENKEDKKENKMEDEKMDNNAQMNNNQYNSLLKEAERAPLENASAPSPILGGTSQTKNDFFPSLEDQPLNMEVPVPAQNDAPTTSLESFSQNPLFDTPPVQSDINNMVPPVAPTLEQEVSNNQGQMPQANMVANVQLPTDSNPLPQMPNNNMVSPTPNPSMDLNPQSQDFNNPNMGPMATPEIPNQPINNAPLMEQPLPPVVDIPPQMPNSPVSPFGPGPQQVPGDMNMVMPNQPNLPPMEPMPNYNMPPVNPQMDINPLVGVNNEMPQPMAPPVVPFDGNMQANQVDMNNQVMPTIPNMQPNNPIITDVMPAVNMVRNVLPLLQNSGYKVVVEEADTPNEYQIIIKVQK